MASLVAGIWGVAARILGSMGRSLLLEGKLIDFTSGH